MTKVSSASDSSNSSDDGGWLDVESEEETSPVVSLFDARTFSTCSEMLDYCNRQYNFDLVATINRLQLDFYGAVKLINFVRKGFQDHKSLPQDITHADIEDDCYLQPILQNDALLISLDDILESNGQKTTLDDHQDSSRLALLIQNSELQEQIESIRIKFENYRLAVQETLDRRWGHEVEPAHDSAFEDGQSNSYFESYASNDIHETMLKDAVRTDAYRDFIYGNKHLFKGKVVLDIGCGTGILSMFCAKAGAAKVIAVDKSEIIVKATENMFNNGLSHIVTCLRGAIEDVKLPVEEVDVIVSEWMGYCLLYEAMLPSVLYARDKYLRAGGLLIPSSATLWIAPICDATYISEHISYWRDVYGFDMKAMQHGIFDEIRVETLSSKSLCGKAFPFKTLDLTSVKALDLSFTAEWESNLDQLAESVDGFLIWFDIFFATSGNELMPEPNSTPEDWVSKNSGKVAFTTGPSGAPTHWKQGLCLIPPEEAVGIKCKKSTISGKISFAALEENARALVVDVSCLVTGGEGGRWSWKLR